MKNIAVIGAGTMGNGIAHVFAQHGYQVNLIDVSADALDKALKTIEKNLDRMLSKEKITAETKEKTLSNLHKITNLKEGVSSADLVVEAATENMDIKLSIFKEMDQFAPANCILSTNTSSISITKIAAATKRADKVIGMHFMNPVPVMKLVEIIKGSQTNNLIVEKTLDYVSSLNKIPVECNDSPGFVSNRILMPMINEAAFTFMEGVASAESIDQIMKLGMGHPMGPLKLADLIGIDVCVSIMNVLFDGFKQEKYRVCPILVKMMKENKLGIKTKEGFYKY